MRRGVGLLLLVAAGELTHETTAFSPAAFAPFGTRHRPCDPRNVAVTPLMLAKKAKAAPAKAAKTAKGATAAKKPKAAAKTAARKAVEAEIELPTADSP